MTWRMVTPPKVRRMQLVLLSVSVTWGLSYTMPADQRIPFSEVFPAKLATASLLPMPGWGYLMLVTATIGIIAEVMLRNDPIQHRKALWTSCVAHNILFLVYAILALAALATGLSEIHWGASAVPNFLSALSRPVLWAGIAFMHHLFANQPKPRKEPS